MVRARCPDCRRSLPKAAFSKDGGGRCRECTQGFVCAGCNSYLPRSAFEDSSGPPIKSFESACRTCRGNAQVDRLLGTPADEVTHFGALAARRLRSEAEYALLLVCHRHGIFHRSVPERILSFARVPYIVSGGGQNYCELCDFTFTEVFARSRVQMAPTAVPASEWAGCPGERLHFRGGQWVEVAEFHKSPQSGRWFFMTQELQRRSDRGDGNPSQKPWYEPRWAPLIATLEGREPTSVAEHLESKKHCDLAALVACGSKIITEHAALDLAKALKERPSTTLSRFRDGLGIDGRFCNPSDTEAARLLQRVRDVDVPPKILREVLPERGGEALLWLRPEELLRAEEAYRQRSRKGSRQIA